MKSLAALAVVVGVASLLPIGPARAGTVGGGQPPAFSIDVSSSVGQDVLHLTPTLTDNGNGTFSVHGAETLPSFSIVFDFTLNPDPVISGSFALQNLSGATQIFSVSATLGGLASIAGPTTISGGFGEGLLSDTNNSESAVLVTAAFYQARIDGVGVQDLGSFNPLEASGGPGITNTISQEAFGPGPGPGVTSSIGVAFPGFSLTAGDRVETPFDFRVVPEPGLASLAVGLGVIFIARAARRRPV